MNKHKFSYIPHYCDDHAWLPREVCECGVAHMFCGLCGKQLDYCVVD